MSTERRSALLNLLRTRAEPVTGTELARRLGVSRQIIVQDVAILRAAGERLLATPRGYLLVDAPRNGHWAVLAVRHSRNETSDELATLVDEGVRVVDVTVEHGLYGEIRAPLMVASRPDVEAFMGRLKETGATLLSDLTDGVHLHTLEAPTPEHLDRAREALRRRGYLLEAAADDRSVS